MREALVGWLLGHGLPAWLAPDYAVTVGVAGIVGAALLLRLTRADGADVAIAARALAVGYLGALLGGYLLEWIRLLPDAVAQRSVEPIMTSGRAAYGGLLGGLGAAALYLRRTGTPLRPFLDRLTPGLGVTFLCVRCGCFLAGCDYGRVTSSALGVRFPPGSLAATAHAEAGWVPVGAASLPVHPTQLYEAALGVVASAAAAYWLVRGHRDGRAFAAWLGTYAVGRFGIEQLRGDPSRGVYGLLSSAQLISLAIVIAIGVALLRAQRHRKAVLAGMAALALLGASRVAAPQSPEPSAPPPDGETEPLPPMPPPTAPPASASPSAGPPQPDPSSSASAQPPPQLPPPPPPTAPPSAQPPPRPGYPQPYPYPYPYPYRYPPPGAHPPPPPPSGGYPPPDEEPDEPPPDPATDDQVAGNQRWVGLRFSGGAYLPVRSAPLSGGLLELDAVIRIAVSTRHRFEVGAEGRLIRAGDADHYGIGVPAGFVFGLASHFELGLSTALFYNAIVFAAPFFEPAQGVGQRWELDARIPIGSVFTLGICPTAITMLFKNDSQDFHLSYEPRLWVGVGF